MRARGPSWVCCRLSSPFYVALHIVYLLPSLSIAKDGKLSFASAEARQRHREDDFY